MADRRSLRFRLSLFLVLFAAGLMASLWLFQSLFLGTSYAAMKTREIVRTAEQTRAAYGNDGFSDLILQTSFNQGIDIEVFDFDGNLLAISDEDDRASTRDLVRFDDFRTRVLASTAPVTYTVQDARVEGSILVYGSVVVDAQGNRALLYVGSPLNPDDATSTVLGKQMLYATALSLLLALVAAVLLSKPISDPIVRITKAAASLAQGRYRRPAGKGAYTEVDQLDHTLADAAAELSRTEDLRRELVGNISHDLRTPLTMVKAYAEMIRDLSGNDRERREAHLKVIIEESDRLGALVSDVLDLSRAESDNESPVRVVLDLGEMVGRILERFHIYTEKEGTVFAFSCDGPALVRADPVRMQQVVYNLVGNAVNYAGADRTVRIRVTDAEGRVRFEVSDTGRGIPPEEQDAIWERYYKSGEPHRRSVVGSGIGLSIVKRILEAHGARFGVVSQVGEGSTFWFELERA